ncbi:ribonuclease H-like domain-containing protein [Tanacetum coccineum]
MHTAKDLEEPAHQEFETEVTKDQPNKETPQFPDWFQSPKKFLLLIKEDPRESFNELIDTPLDFLAFLMNRLKVDTLTPVLLTGPTFKLMKGSCKSLVELEYLFEEVYKETTDQLDWNNPEGQQYPHDLRKPLPLIPNSRGCRVIPIDNFINNDLVNLSGGVSSQKYETSVTKTKAIDYWHIKWIEDLGRKRQQFYGFAANRESACDVFSKHRIIVVTKLEIVDWHNYKHLDWIIVRRDDDKLYKFKEGDFNRLHIQDIEDMLLLVVQGKLTNLTVEERPAFNVSLRMFTRSVVIQRRVEDFQNKDKKNRLMRIDELHKFSDGTLNDVRTALNDRLKGIQMDYLPQTIWRQSDKDKAGGMIQAIDKQLKTRRIMRSLDKFVGRRPYEDKMDSMHSTLSMYYNYGAYVKGELLREYDETPPNSITPDLPITDSLVREDEHLDTILEMDSDEEVESSIENLNLTPSESEDLSNYWGDIMVPTTPLRKSSILASIGLRFIEMPMTWSHEITVGENSASWSDKLDDALWAFHTAFKTTIGCTPYKLMYGKACHLPIELEHKAYWALKHCNFDLKTAGDHRKVQMNELNELRDQAYENSLIYKEKTKKIHDSKIKNRDSPDYEDSRARGFVQRSLGLHPFACYFWESYILDPID